LDAAILKETSAETEASQATRAALRTAKETFAEAETAKARAFRARLTVTSEQIANAERVDVALPDGRKISRAIRLPIRLTEPIAQGDRVPIALPDGCKIELNLPLDLRDGDSAYVSSGGLGSNEEPWLILTFEVRSGPR
jgi:hypothetical protein